MGTWPGNTLPEDRCSIALPCVTLLNLNELCKCTEILKDFTCHYLPGLKVIDWHLSKLANVAVF